MDHISSQLNTEWGFEDYLGLVLRRRWIILITFTIVFGLAVHYSLTRPNKYSASTTFSIEDTQDSGLGGDARFASSLFRKGSGKSKEYYQAIIDSKPYSDKVIHIADIDSMLQANGPVSAREVLQVLNNLSIEQDEMSNLFYLNISAYEPVLAYRIADIAAIAFKDRASEIELESAENVVEYVNYQIREAELKLDKAEQELQRFRNTTKFVVTDEKNSAIERLNAYETKITEIETQLKLSQANLETYAVRIARFNGNGNTGLMYAESNEVKQLRARLHVLEAEQRTVIESGEDNAYRLRELDAKIGTIKGQIRQFLLKLSGDNGEHVIMSNKENVYTVLREREIAEELNVYSLSNEHTYFKTLRNDFLRQHPNMLEDALRAAKLQRAKTVASNLYSFLIQQGEEAKIRASAKNGGLLVVSPPLLPQKPMPQNKGRNIFIGIILGFGLGFGIAFVYDIMDKSICSPDDLKKHTGLDVVGVIPKVDNVQKKQSKSSRGKGGKNTGFDALSSNGASARSYLLLPRLSTKHPMVEAFRNLRMDLQFVNVDEPLKNLIISSSTPYEGKTQTTVNLAISYAELDMNVLIVDCDLRKPKQHQVFEVQRSPGLTDYLARDIPLEDIIKATSFVNVQVLPAGTTPPNPTEMLGSNKMKNLLTLVDDMYDFVLFDTPPIIAVSDAKMLAQRVKNVLLVVRAAKTNYQVITEAKARLEKVEAYIVGAVLNGVEMRKGYGYNYQYNYYYEDYYSSGSKKKRSKSKRKVKA